MTLIRRLSIHQFTICICIFQFKVKGQRVTLQTLQPSAKVKGLVGSSGLVVNGSMGKDLKPRRKTSQSSSVKIAVFEDKAREAEVRKNRVEDRGVQTECETSSAIQSMISGKR